MDKRIIQNLLFEMSSLSLALEILEEARKKKLTQITASVISLTNLHPVVYYFSEHGDGDGILKAFELMWRISFGEILHSEEVLKVGLLTYDLEEEAGRIEGVKSPPKKKKSKGTFEGFSLETDNCILQTAREEDPAVISFAVVNLFESEGSSFVVCFYSEYGDEDGIERALEFIALLVNNGVLNPGEYLTADLLFYDVEHQSSYLEPIGRFENEKLLVH